MTAPHVSHLGEKRIAHLKISSYTRISDAIMSPKVKSIANYRNSELAVQEARPAGYDGPILLSRLGEASEGAWSNLFIVRGGVLITPDLASDVLAGLTRDTLIQLSQSPPGQAFRGQTPALARSAR
jgi:branched-chain amino acid aminotransferase